MSLLEVSGLNSYYGDSHILFDVGLRVEKHEVVALLGRNGAGKSTTLKSLMGVVAPRSGSVRLEGIELSGRKSHAIAQCGMQLVHEDRRIFGSLDVEENLVLAGLTAKDRWPLERIYGMFPRLKERRRSRGTDLSGGEQQMLAIARALLTGPDLLLLDEPSQGLAPIVVNAVMDTIRSLKAEHVSMLLVEQNAEMALQLADRVYVIDHGTVVFEGTPERLRADRRVTGMYLGVGG
jgi:branched-chain amino acid transport system ATP-binding protein